VRSALKEVKGVQRVKIDLETGDAVVTYDPRVATTDAMIAAVKNAKGVNEYTATVKRPKG
jgi:copper chaperone CopZ